MRQTFTRITINGVTYNRVEEMPPDVRKQYEQTLGRLMEDRNQNGVPDLFEQRGTSDAVVEHVTTQVFDASISRGKIPPEQIRRIETMLPSGGGRIHISMPTLLALLATAALLAAAIVWMMKS